MVLGSEIDAAVLNDDRDLEPADWRNPGEDLEGKLLVGFWRKKPPRAGATRLREAKALRCS